LTFGAAHAFQVVRNAPFAAFAANRDRWAEETSYVYPGPIQYFGPSCVCDLVTKTLTLEKGGSL